MTAIKRIFDFPYYQLETYNLSKAFTTKYNGEWKSISTKEYIDKANAISRGLLKLGVQPNDKIAVISTTNRTEWNVLDIGVLQVGAQNVPIYPTICKEDYEYILNHSEAIYCFASYMYFSFSIARPKPNRPALSITAIGLLHLRITGKDSSFTTLGNSSIDSSW